LIIIAILGFFPNVVHAALQTVSVVILPFEVHAKEELSYLQTEIPGVLANQLKQEGARVLVLDPKSLPQWKEQIESIAAIRKIGQQNGADFVVWGSLTWIATQFSIDVKLLDIVEGQKPNVFSKDGKGIENLPVSVQDIGDDVSLILFKREKVVKIVIKGNDRIEVDAIQRLIKTKPGDLYNKLALSQDLKSIYSMGYFDDVRIGAESTPEGMIVFFDVKEKPTLRSIKISGDFRVFDEEEVKEALTIRTGSILNFFKINNDIGRIEEMFKEKNYHNVKVDFKITQRKKNQADIEFIIDEGAKVQVAKIEFEGNQAYSDKKLKGLMTTSEKNILSWVTSAGDLVQQNLDQDVAQIKSFYHNSGYIRARVGEPRIEYEGNDIKISIDIDEGPQFKVGRVSVEGDLILPEKKLLEKISISDEEFYNREALRNDIIALSDIYANEGYANVDISPLIDQDQEKLVVHITFEISKNAQVYFERIIISGNSKTRDKVIRRQLRVYEQELFSAARLKRSVQNLYRLDFFEEVKVDTTAGSAENKKNLKIEVREKSTGSFQFGAGYGNVENFFAVINIAERNLFGRGQRLALESKLGAETTKFTLSFTEPWLFDIPLSFGVEAYNWDYSFEDYDKHSIGGSVKIGYPLFEYTRGSLKYIYDLADVSNISDTAASSISELKGENVKSSITAALNYDSRNSIFFPTRGSDHHVSAEFAGLGGDIGFHKYIAETAWYYKIFWKLIGVLHAKGGYVKGLEGELLPDYELFHLGGIGSLRGFERGDLAPRDDNGDEVGGDNFWVANIETRFPIIEDAGLYGVLFFDIGNVYGENKEFDITDNRMSAGPGIKWLSPMGPINLFYGFILDPEDEDANSGSWEFTMATSF
jgi:outer membrane protein insertion porin family